MYNLNSGHILSFKEDVFYYQVDDGIYFRNNKGYFNIRMADSDKMLLLLDKINFGITINQLTMGLDSKETVRLAKLLDTLYNRNFLILYNTEESRENYTQSIDYYSRHWNLSWQNLEQINVIIFSREDVSDLNDSLEYYGLKNIKLVCDVYQVNVDDICIISLSEYQNEILEKVLERRPKFVLLLEKKEKRCVLSLIRDIDRLNIINENNSIKNYRLCSEKKPYNNIFRENPMNFYNKENCLHEKSEDESYYFNKGDMERVLYSIIGMELIKLITGCDNSLLEDNVYIFDFKSFIGKYFPLKTIKDSANFKFEKDNKAFYQYIEGMTNNIGASKSVTRGESIQLPLSQWTVRMPDGRGNQINIVGFGDTHDEARYNTYIASLEEYIRCKHNSETEGWEVCCSTQGNDLENYGILKCILKKSMENDAPQDYKEFLLNDFGCSQIQYYRKVIEILDIHIKLYCSSAFAGIKLVKIEDKKSSIINAGFSFEEALINSLRLFIFVLQNKLEDFDNKKINRSFFYNINKNENVLKTSGYCIKIKDLECGMEVSGMFIKMAKFCDGERL